MFIFVVKIRIYECTRVSFMLTFLTLSFWINHKFSKTEHIVNVNKISCFNAVSLKPCTCGLSEPVLQLVCRWTHRILHPEHSGGAHPQRQRPGGRDHGSEQDHGTTFHGRGWGCESNTETLMETSKYTLIVQNRGLEKKIIVYCVALRLPFICKDY